MADKIPYSKKDLLRTGPQRKFKGAQLEQVAFPLGGIGTGSISLGGRGQLRDWEIMNRPAKGARPEDTFFAIRIRSGKISETRVMQAPMRSGYNIGGQSSAKGGGEGLPCFRDVVFQGEFPFATVSLKDDNAPVAVDAEAFSPFIPLNDKDSSLPIAVLNYTVKNTSGTSLNLSFYGCISNMAGGRKPTERNAEARTEHGITALLLSGESSTSKNENGEIVVASTADAIANPSLAVGQHGGLNKLWEAIAWEDTLPEWDGRKRSDYGVLAHDFVLPAGKEKTIRVMIGWYFPTFEYWEKPKCEDGCECEPESWKNWYATQWSSAWDVVKYAVGNYDRLESETRLFHDTLFESTLPAVALDAVSSQISTLRTCTCLRGESGIFYGFEGCSDTSGCCEGSCTHVWNYAQALPYLFPRLQRSMREADYEYAMTDDDGAIQFRRPLPDGTRATQTFHPCGDGQMGSVLCVYREWMISGDDDWLRKIWPKTMKALEFAWKYWDADKDGVMEGMQHNTYDNEFHGANTMMGSLYLGALRAAEEMARYLGEKQKAGEYRAVFENGSRLTDEKQWNGEYYEQIVATDAAAAWPEKFRELGERYGRDDKFPEWPKWQYGRGCLSDQLIGQWYAEMLGLGKLYNEKNVKNALKSVFKYNWRSDLGDHAALFRIYALNDEEGLIICTWPRGERPGYAFWFADEVWCGIEYQVASNLIYEGMVEEGMAIVKGVRDRHDGERRNPWNEFECGHHYTRSMASYSVLTALSGFSYHGSEKRIGFEPRFSEKNFKSFFSVGRGWGSFALKQAGERTRIELDVRYGSLPIKTITLPKSAGKDVVTANIGDQVVAAKAVKRDERLTIELADEVDIEPGKSLFVVIG